MLKVSFKDKEGCPAKKIEMFNDRATIVTLNGTMTAPEWWWKIPKEIHRWMTNHPSVEVYDNLLGNVIIKVTGKSVCSEEDTFSSKLGARIAEARAKIKLYRFMYKLTILLKSHYRKNIYGNFELKLYNTTFYGEPPIPCLYADINKYWDLYKKEKDHLDNLLKMS